MANRTKPIITKRDELVKAIEKCGQIRRCARMAGTYEGRKPNGAYVYVKRANRALAKLVAEGEVVKVDKGYDGIFYAAAEAD